MKDMLLAFLLSSLLLTPAQAATIKPQQADVAYGPERQQRLDVYRPEQARNAPAIVMVHGGAWRIGDKKADKVVRNKGEHWLERGFVFVSVNYRLNTDPVSQADDVARALAYVQTHATELGADPGQVILAGHSAGAHLVSLLSANPAKALAQGAKPWLGTVSLDSAAMDIVELMSAPHYRFYNPVFGKDRSFWEQTSPFHQLRPSAPPMLLVCSTVRPDQPCRQAEAFAAQAGKLGVRVEVLPQAREHEAINADLGVPGDYTERVDAFIASLLNRK